MPRRSTLAITTLLAVLVLALLVVQTSAWVGVVDPGEYNRTSVVAVDENGTRLGTVDVRIADTQTKRQVGLSNTESLGPDEGMLFVHDEEGQHAYVMREMDFPLDIVFVAANGTVTTIHHAAAPDSWTLEMQLAEYAGHGKYVLEANRGWTNRTGLDEGDRIRVTDRSIGSQDRCRGLEAIDTAESAPEHRPRVAGLDANGTTLGNVTVRVADNGTERFTGLSDTASLGPDEGMLFVHDEEGQHAYVMREMDFPLDIVFVAANGTVTAAHHAEVPPEGTDESELQRYRGTGKYVLEVNRGWTNETGLDVGDRICFPERE